MATLKRIISELGKQPLSKMFLFSIFASLVTIFVGFIAQFILPPEIPLLYGLPLTSEQIVPSIFITIPSAIALLFTVANILISISLHDNYLKKSLAFTSLIITVLSLVATFKIIFLVGLI